MALLFSKPREQPAFHARRAFAVRRLTLALNPPPADLQDTSGALSRPIWYDLRSYSNTSSPLSQRLSGPGSRTLLISWRKAPTRALPTTAKAPWAPSRRPQARAILPLLHPRPPRL